MVLHNYFIKQYCQTNVKQEEKRLWYTSLRGRIQTNKWNYDKNHETTWLSTWQYYYYYYYDPSQLTQSSDTNLLPWQWMYRVCQASSISRYITTFFH